MRKADLFPMHTGWRMLLRDLGVNASRVLQRAGLPRDLFARENASVTTDEYFALWRGLEEEAADPLLGLRIGRAVSVEMFDPLLFAALSSPNLATALPRIARYKRLIGPMTLQVKSGAEGLRLEIVFTHAASVPPVSLATAELIFFVQLARLATRANVIPLKVMSPAPPQPAADYGDYFGRPVQRAKSVALVFTAEDAARPFLTANEKMWEFFEPELRRNLSCLTGEATTAQRTRAALLEMLPAGESAMPAVAKKLGMSARTLQRRLGEERQGYQELLDQIREELARYYLKTTKMSGAEISFLIGYEHPSSFFRAFGEWTGGQTPEQVRNLASA